MSDADKQYKLIWQGWVQREAKGREVEAVTMLGMAVHLCDHMPTSINRLCIKRKEKKKETGPGLPSELGWL